MRGETLRAFFAVELPSEARAAVTLAMDAMCDVCEAPLRWVPESNLHLTSKFLGEVEVEKLPQLARRAAARLARESAFEVELGGLGAFPTVRSARVLWLGVAEGASRLARLARKLDAAGARLGVERDRKPYRAHLTLARLAKPAPLALDRVPAPAAIRFPVREVVLFESRSRADAGASPEYVPWVRLPLGAQEAPDFDFAPEL